eukprot:TRINITY_DN321_c0_g1_i2.p1 TRINITY_DN321_c0_g1~~TRINITY_DN321_c0_g1_i2.p1  ORF type:complete len:276 (-),score=53.18 TRINITY_DN321_c0_g1_i2:404-1156(-)
MGDCASKGEIPPSAPTLLCSTASQVPNEMKHSGTAALDAPAWVSMVSSLDIESLGSSHLLKKARFEISYGQTSTLTFPKSDLPELSPEQTATCPKLKVTGLPGDIRKCVVIMTDPDAPSKDEPLFREFIHMVATEVPVTADGELQLEKGNVALPYVGPAPPYNSGLHRYIFLVYAQTGSDPAAGLLAALSERGGKKAAKTALELDLGQPLVYGGFWAQWDESCDAAHEALGFVPPEKWRSPKQIVNLGSS